MAKADNKAAKLLPQLQDKYGAESIMMANQIPKRPVIGSGSLALDYATGIGGFPSDRVIEIAGQEGSGKTTLGLLAMSNFLDADPSRAALILDTEHKLDSEWVSTLVGPGREDRVVITYPDTIEQATNIYVSAVAGDAKLKIPGGTVGFVLFDSIGGSPTARRNTDFEVAGFGGNSGGVTEFARIAGGLSHKHHCLTIGINQVREDMTGYHRHMTPGGRGWKHACSLRLQLKRGSAKITEKINGEDWQIGFEVACKVVKSGLSAEGRVASWYFYNVPTQAHGFGVDRIDEIVRLGILTEVIERKGGWYHHPTLPAEKGEHRILGRDRLMDFIGSDKAVQQTLSQEIKARLADHASEVAPMSDPDAPLEDSYLPDKSHDE